MSEPRRENACTIAFDEAQAAGLPGGGYVAAHWCQACEAAESTHTFRRLRAENADLRAAACTCGSASDGGPFAAHAAGCPAVERVRMREERDHYRARADRYAAALAHIEALGHHGPDCEVADPGDLPPCADTTEPDGPTRCGPACPSATAKKAREGT